MELRTEAAPTRRVLGADDGAPLDGDRILAVALRWADRPLSVEHLEVGQVRSPLEGVEIRWEGSLPVVAISEGAHAWVERSLGQWVDPGRRAALDLGETLIVQSGELTLEARIERRSEKAPAARRQESLFFGLVMTHSLMLFIALTVAMVITPRTDEGSMWGAPSMLTRAIAPFSAIPRSKKQALEDRIKEVVQTATFRPLDQPQKKTTAKDAMRLLMGGGGGLAGLLAKGSSALDEAMGNMKGPSNSAGNGFNGIGARDLGNGVGNGPVGIGKLPGGGPGPGGLPGGLRGHRIADIVCRSCTPVLTPGYDRDLVLKVVRRHQNEIRFCYESELSKAPELAGKVTVAWTISASGAVEVAQIAESGLANERVEACIVQRVKRWTFPEPQGGQEVAITFPWVFSVAGSEE